MTFLCRQIAGFVQPYNPFFQTTIVNIFEQYFDTALSFQEQAICVITNAISLLAKQCGWDGRFLALRPTINDLRI